MCEKVYEKISSGKIKWSFHDKGKYTIAYTTIPCFYLGKIIAKTKIPEVNSCLESDVYLFKTFKEMENFFENLIS